MIDTKSKTFWSNKTEELRTILADTVAGSDVLTDERRSELETIIIEYQRLNFKESFWQFHMVSFLFYLKNSLTGMILNTE